MGISSNFLYSDFGVFLRRFLNGIECLRWFYSLTYSSKEPRSQRLPLGDHFFARPGCTRENRRWPSGAAWEKKCHPTHRQQQTAGGRQIRPPRTMHAASMQRTIATMHTRRARRTQHQIGSALSHPLTYPPTFVAICRPAFLPGPHPTKNRFKEKSSPDRLFPSFAGRQQTLT